MHSPDELYLGREQTFVKHEMLRKYLERFAHIVGFHWPSITYIDGFSGPWNERTDDFRDSSFAIAVDELKTARTHLADRGKSLHVRCFFVEKDVTAFQRLKQFAEKVAHEAQIEVRTENLPFEEAIPSIISYIKKAPGTFPFVFIDPCGWTGYGMDAISSLLSLTPSEVLINFMTGHILRFIDDEQSQDGFHSLFGSPDVAGQFRNHSGDDRIDVIIEKYCHNLRKTAQFDYVCPSIILDPDKRRPG